LRAVLDRRPITLEGSGSARLLRTTTPGKDSIRKDSAYLRFDLVLLPKCYERVRLAAAGASVYAQAIELPDVFMVAGEGLEPPTPGL
jgi:hypothetical protein